MGSISSIQCLGGSGFSSAAAVIRTSAPHNSHLYKSFTFLNSPGGGGSGGGVAKDLRIKTPIFIIKKAIAIATTILKRKIV